jgi:hypothetical protein
VDNLNAEICFALKSHNEDVVNLIGTGIQINIDIHSIAPVILIRKGNVAKSIYRIASNGNINQIFGDIDILLDVKILNDITIKYLPNFRMLRFLLSSSFKCLSLDEIILHKSELQNIENEIFDKCFNTNMSWDLIKKQTAKSIKNLDLSNEIISKIIDNISKCKCPNKIYLNNKIDVNLVGYNVKIRTVNTSDLV